MAQSGPPPPAPAPPLPVAGARKPDASKTPLNKRAYTFRLTFSRLLTSVIVALIGLGWVFMLGVMAGRGYNPDAKLQELTGRVLRGRQASAVQEPPQEILRPEELNFGAALRDKPLHNSTAAMGPSALPHPPAGRTNNATANSVAGNATAVQIEQPPGQPVPQGAQPVRFDFVYQVAAFRDAAQADTLRERLEGEGVRTGMDKSPARDGKSLYKVLVMRRGTEDDDRQLLAVFERLKLGPPLLRSKKPVSGGGGAR